MVILFLMIGRNFKFIIMRKLILTFILFSTTIFYCCNKPKTSDAGFTKPDSNLNSGSNKYSSKSNFEVEISSNKSEYYQLEPVWITVKIKNIGSAIDSFSFINNDYMLRNLIVSDMNGNDLKGNFPLIEYGNPDYIKLKSNEQMSFDICVNFAFGENKLLKDHPIYIFYPEYYFEKGKYEVKFKFDKDISGIGREHDNKFINSNKIEFSVKTPDKNEMKIFNRIIEINKTNEYENQNGNEFITDLKKLYDKNQNSIYSEELFYNYIHNTAYKNAKSGEFLDLLKSFYEKYPDSYFNQKVAESLILLIVNNTDKTKEEVINYLKEIMDKHPNTKIKEAISFYINEDFYLNKLFSRKSRRVNKS